MRKILLLMGMWLCAVTIASAQVGVNIGLPGINIGINVPAYPRLVRVPGYPVYYASQIDANYFFYDGMYWVYSQDNWYASSWYNGPWQLVAPDAVPLYVLRVPVRYYRRPPEYFHGWRYDAPPRWDQHWGRDWQQRRSGWDHWNRNAAPAPAPLPSYQQQYSGNRYPRPDQQSAVHERNYRYQPRDENVQRHYQSPQGQRPQARSEQQAQRPQSRSGQGAQWPAQQPPGSQEDRSRYQQ